VRGRPKTDDVSKRRSRASRDLNQLAAWLMVEVRRRAGSSKLLSVSRACELIVKDAIALRGRAPQHVQEAMDAHDRRLLNAKTLRKQYIAAQTTIENDPHVAAYCERELAAMLERKLRQ